MVDEVGGSSAGPVPPVGGSQVALRLAGARQLNVTKDARRDGHQLIFSVGLLRPELPPRLVTEYVAIL